MFSHVLGMWEAKLYVFMPTLFQINVTCNWGSTGRIAEEIGQLAISQGWDSYIAYGRGKPTSQSHLIRIGNDWDMYEHGVESRLLDNHGLASRGVTRKLIRQIEEIHPDVIHLHNIHGYFINYQILFDYLAKSGIPVVWTLHDCWTFTGHCSHFSYNGCYQWRDGECEHCKYKTSYPASFVLNRAHRNFLAKKNAFTAPKDVTIVPVSHWLEGLVKQSFLGCHQVKTIHNGVNIHTFKPKNNREEVRQKQDIKQPFMLIGVASVWGESKGIYDFIKLRKELPLDKYAIVLLGVDDKLAKTLPDGIVVVKRTNNVDELADIYSAADIVLNLSYQETFGMTTVEGFACGTPGIVYNATASPELMSADTGMVIAQGDISALASAVEKICHEGKDHYSAACRQRAILCFNKEERYLDYIEVYKGLLG